jgi:serine phosphatase RsbU (regulator of sigma subunit)
MTDESPAYINKQTRHLPATAAAVAIVDAVFKWMGPAPQHDDVTVVVVKGKDGF